MGGVGSVLAWGCTSVGGTGVLACVVWIGWAGC